MADPQPPLKGSPLLMMPFVYMKHGTYLVRPNLCLYGLPVGLKFVLRFIQSGKEYPDACEATRIDIDRKLSAAP